MTWKLWWKEICQVNCIKTIIKNKTKRKIIKKKDLVLIEEEDCPRAMKCHDLNCLCLSCEEDTRSFFSSLPLRLYAELETS